MELNGTPLVAGAADGSLLFADEPLSFWGGYDARNGEIIDRRHPLSGQNAAESVLVVPATRGSSTTTAVLLEAVRAGTAPAAIVTCGDDTFLALAAIVARELYDTSPAIVALAPADFEALGAEIAATGDWNARIVPSGRIRVYRR